MGKRKHSDKDDYSHIMKKIKKLEKKLKRSRRKREPSSDSHLSDAVQSIIEDGSPAQLELPEVDHDMTADVLPTANDHDHNRVTSNPERPQREPSPVASTSNPTIVSEPQPGTSQADVEPPVDSFMLELLGDDPSIITAYGKEINSDLAIRLQHMVTNGLSTDMSKELQGKYLPPSNCKLIAAPTLNPEIKAAITETILKRDKGIEQKQKTLACAITCVAEALSALLKEENKNVEVIKLLMDASRLLCDCQNGDSKTRRNFVLFNLKKDMRDQLQKTKIDTSLFGSDLAETIKTAKFISKSGAELKSVPPPKPSTAKSQKQTASTMPQRNLNWKAPPHSRRPKGNQEQKEPAQRSQRASSSRQSYRAPPSRNRSRR